MLRCCVGSFRHFRLPLLLAVGAFVGCDARETDPAADALPLWTLHAELRIGSLDGAEDGLTHVEDLRIGPEGHLYSLHPAEQTVRVFAADGRFLRTVGRRGEGPGEFRRPLGLGWRGDTLWVQDRGGRLSLFAPDGRLLETLFLQPAAGEEHPLRIDGLLPDGSMLARPALPTRLIATGEVVEEPYLRVDRGGAVLDTLLRVSLANETLAIVDPADSGGGGTYDTQPFGDAPLVRISEAEPVWYRLERRVEEEPRFTLSKHDFGGETLWERSYTYPPQPVATASVDSIVDYYARYISGLPFPGAPSYATAERWTRAALYVPAHRPAVEELLLGRDGTLWLREAAPAGEAPVWLVLDAAGEHLARVALPVGLRLLQADRESVWGSETDELDVPYLVRYRIVPAAGPA